MNPQFLLSSGKKFHMNHHYSSIPNQAILKKLTALKTAMEEKRQAALKKRLSESPFFTDLEYLLGAFVEMYQPYLYEIIFKFAKKGYHLDPSSGFWGKYSELQSLNVNMTLDYVNRNKLEKNGIKFREFNGLKSLVYWPEEADLDKIKERWLAVSELLPDKGALESPSTHPDAVIFRRKYIPKDSILQRKRLFEKLQFNIRKETIANIKKRKESKIPPTKTEICLGLFVEELEIQVKDAVLQLHEKGYSIDTSGFMQNPCYQMIEGDFQLKEDVITSLKKIGVEVETNPSGYTRLQFSTETADIKKIQKMWKSIVTLLPNRKEKAFLSMTRNARDFRIQFST